MAMLFPNVLKGQITQSLIKTLFERAGYRVTRLGVEELFDEIVHLDEAQYLGLNLPLPLRYLPDFLIADQNLERASLLEVKFRKVFDESTIQSLHDDLKRQRLYWPESYAVILTTQWPGRFHQDYIRIVKPHDLESLNVLSDHNVQSKEWCERNGFSFPERIWNQLSFLQHVFFNFSHGSGNQNWQNADFITTTIRDLGKL